MKLLVFLTIITTLVSCGNPSKISVDGKNTDAPTPEVPTENPDNTDEEETPAVIFDFIPENPEEEESDSPEVPESDENTEENNGNEEESDEPEENEVENTDSSDEETPETPENEEEVEEEVEEEESRELIRSYTRNDTVVEIFKTEETYGIKVIDSVTGHSATREYKCVSTRVYITDNYVYFWAKTSVRYELKRINLNEELSNE